MKPLSLEEVRKAVHGHWLSAGSQATVSAVTTDTRTARDGELFFAIRGERFDGHVFLPQAAQAGCASAVVCLDGEPRPETADKFRGGVIGVTDSTKALGALASYHRRILPATVVAVTGSNGKTTVKRMIDHILAKRFVGACSPKSFNNQIGVPLTLLSAGAGDKYVICEIGSSGPGEVASLAAMVGPAVAVITNVGETHLEKLGTVERVAAEKASILGRLEDSGLAVVWADDHLLDRLARGYQKRMVTFGQADSADLRLTGYQPKGDRQRFEVNGRLWVDLPVAGKHNALNGLAAMAVAQRFGFSQADAAEALGDFQGVEMRMQWLDCGQVTVINDAYNANPTSMLAAARVLSDVPGRRRVLVAGDMGELGPASQQLHLRTGEQIARTRVDLLIGVGPLGRYIAQGAAELGLDVQQFDTVTDAGDAISQSLHVGDVVLIKASRMVRMERLVDAIRAAFG